jgi:ribosomal 50S subunit-recycling heat shock protein
MIMFGNGAWVKVWKCEKGQGNYYMAQMSSSRKNQEGQYETDWSDGRVRLVGTAAKQAEKIKAGDRLQIENCGVTNTYDKEKKTTYTNYVVFAFSNNADSTQTQAAKPTKTTKTAKSSDVTETSDDELPFN